MNVNICSARDCNEKCENIYCSQACKRREVKKRRRDRKIKSATHYKRYCARKVGYVFAPLECDSSCNSSWD